MAEIADSAGSKPSGSDSAEAVCKSFGLKTMQLNDQKAGMEGLDKELINKIIHDASKGTSYYTFQQKRQQRIDQKVNEMLSDLKTISELQRIKSKEKMNLLAATLEKERDLSHNIVHIDMDAFYAAVEMLDKPELRNQPMAVGSLSMLSTSNYHARKFGVRAAMPGFIAKKLCPQLVIVPSNFEKYRKVSHEIRNIVKEYDPNFSPAGLDELYLDLTEYILKINRQRWHEKHCHLTDELSESEDEDEDNHILPKSLVTSCKQCHNRNWSITDSERDHLAYVTVQEIRERIYNTTQLTASAGIAPNTMLAKVCSDQNKPNGQFQIHSNIEDVKKFILSLSVKKVSGIGPVQVQLLNALEIYTCENLWHKRDLLDILFSPTSTHFYINIALGLGSITVKSDYVRKSIGVEETFKEIQRPEDHHHKCEELCDEMIGDLKSRNLMGKVVILKIKTVNFDSHTRNLSLPYHTSDKEIIIGAAKKLLDAEISVAAPEPLKLRLMGIRMSNLIGDSSSEKQQVKLKDFLQSKPTLKNSKTKDCTSSASPNNLICPVCNQEMKINLSAFNQHLDECLNSLNEDQAHASSYDENKECKLIDIPSEEILKGVNNESDNCISRDSYSKSFTNNQISDLDDSNFETSALNTDISKVMLCPICGKEQEATNLVGLNVHIDNCLSKGKIKEILSEETPDPTQADKRKIMHSINQKPKRAKTEKRLSKKIEDYFQLSK